MCYQWPQSAHVISLLSGFAAAVKCQVKCHRRSIQRLGRRNGKTPIPGQVGTDVKQSPEPQNTVSEPLSRHQPTFTKYESHLYAAYSKPLTQKN